MSMKKDPTGREKICIYAKKLTGDNNVIIHLTQAKKNKKKQERKISSSICLLLN